MEMASFLHLNWVFVFGLLGNIISFFVCLAPLPTFYRIWKKKTSEGYQCLPYIIALFSAMLWLFYAYFKDDTTLLITINSFAFAMEIIYIFVYLLYATKKDMISTLKLVVFINVISFGIICTVALGLLHGKKRVDVLGWICMIFSLCVFVAPLGIVRKVIKTKSVEFMPFYLSLFLTISAVMWFFYGFLKKDKYVAVPNILGFAFGIIQMVLYMIYRNSELSIVEPKNSKIHHQLSDDMVVDVDKLSVTICPGELIAVAVANSDHVINANDIVEIEIIEIEKEKAKQKIIGEVPQVCVCA